MKTSIKRLMLSFSFLFLFSTQSTPMFNSNNSVFTEEQASAIMDLLQITNQEYSRQHSIDNMMPGNTELHKAVLHSNLDKVKEILDKNTNELSIQNGEGNTPLHLACALDLNKESANYKDKSTIIQQINNLLIDEIENSENATEILNTQNKYGITAFHAAIGTNKIDTIKKLINTKKINTEIKENEGYTALLIAAKKGFTDIVKLLATSQNIFKTNTDGNNALHLASQSTNIETIKLILDKDPSKTILFTKNNDNIYPAQYLYNNQLLVKKQLEFFNFLVKSLEQDNVDLFIKKIKRIKTNNIENIVELQYKNNILHITAYKGSLEKVKALFNNFKINVNTINTLSNTPLHLATLNENNDALEIIKLLIEKEAIINAMNKSKDTPLHFSVMKDNPNNEIIEYLLQKGADANASNTKNITPFKVAIQKNNLPLITLLIKYGANITPKIFELAKEQPYIIKKLKKAQQEQQTKKIDATTAKAKSNEENLSKLIQDLEISGKQEKKSKQKPSRKKKKLKKKKIDKYKLSNKMEKLSNKEIKEKHETIMNQRFYEQAEALKRSRLKQENEKEEQEKQLRLEQLKKEALKIEKKEAKEEKNKKRKHAVETIEKNYIKRNKIDNAIKYIHEINCIKKLNEILFWHRFQTAKQKAHVKINTFQKAINFRTDNGDTILHLFTIYATNYETKKLILFLINIGLDINSVNNDGYTALHLAVTRQQTELVQLFIENGAEINTQENYLGSSPLHDAVNLRNNKILKILLTHKNIDLNIQTNNGITPLHIAAKGRFGNQEAINLLLKNEAKPEIQDNAGRTADTYSQNFKIINMLTGQTKQLEENFNPFKNIDPIEAMQQFKNPAELKKFLDFLQTDDPTIFDALIKYLQTNKSELFQKIQNF